MLTPAEVIKLLNLTPNTDEGGYYASTYVSETTIPNYPGQRAICSAIYYFIDQSTFSGLHTVSSDMLYHFYSGNPVEVLLLHTDGSHQLTIFGGDLAAGQLPMKVIPGGTWMGSRMLGDGSYALMGVSMAPGFDFHDYKIGIRADLQKQYPDIPELIAEFTR